jgi:hypothetical protein
MGSSIGSLVGGVAGSFIGGPAGTAIGSQLGGLAGSAIGGSSGGSSAAKAQGNAAQAISGAGKTGQQIAQFRPVGVTTNFGQSNFGYDPTTGQMTSAGYSLSPSLQEVQNQITGGLGASYNQGAATAAQYAPLQSGASSLFNLGQQYLATSPEQAAATWYNQQQGLLAGGREQQISGLRNRLFQTGRTGLATGGTTTGMAATNPELAAYYNSIAQGNQQLAAQADEYGMRRAQFGAGLFGSGSSLLDRYSAGQVSAYSPFQTQVGLSGTIEGLGQNAFDLSSGLGARTAAAGGTAGQIGLAGARGSSPYMVEQQSYNPLSQVLGGTSASSTGALGGKLGNWFGDLIGGGSGMGLLNSSRTSGDYMNAIGATSSGPLGTSNPYANESWM